MDRTKQAGGPYSGGISYKGYEPRLGRPGDGRLITSDFSAFAGGATVRPPRPLEAKYLQAKMLNIVSRVAKECTRSGAYLIGNIKCILETKENGHLAITTTDPQEPPYWRGDLAGEIDTFSFKINVLLYGLNNVTIKRIVESAINDEIGSEGSMIDMLKVEHHEHHHDDDHDHDH